MHVHKPVNVVVPVNVLNNFHGDRRRSAAEERARHGEQELESA